MNYLLLGLYAFLPVAVWAGSADNLAQLQRMNTAIHALNYYGTMVYLHDGQMESLRVIHKNDGHNESERVLHLTGIAREVVRENDRVSRIMPDIQSVVVAEQQRANRQIFDVDVTNADFANYYQLNVVGTGRVAGRDVKVLKIEPKDSLRYGYQLWLDNKTGLLLRSELVGVQGTLLEQFMFAQVDIVESIPKQMLQPGLGPDGKEWQSAEQRPAAAQAAIDPGWQVMGLPAGFSLLAHYNKKLPDSAVSAEHLVVGDGLASVSIYIEALADQSQIVVGTSKLGAVNMLGSVLDNHQLTVVGEVPENTIHMIAESVRYQAGQ